jgi:hypothetical protein
MNKIGLINRYQLSKYNNINGLLVIPVNNIFIIFTFRELARCNTKGFTSNINNLKNTKKPYRHYRNRGNYLLKSKLYSREIGLWILNRSNN